MKVWCRVQGKGSGVQGSGSGFSRGSGFGGRDVERKARIMVRGGSTVRRAGRAVLALLTTVLVVGLPGMLLAMQPPTGAAQDGFVPLDKLPPQEQLPAAPLLITAYAFVWVLLMAYLWSIARRLLKVETEIQTLQRRSSGSSAR